MTTDESETSTEPSADDPHQAQFRAELDKLRAELESTKDRLDAAERNLRWMAQRQATETGKSICPNCNAGGALSVERTATGKKKVECKNCGERFI